MAYRKLRDTDLVRIIGGEYGYNGVVLDAGELVSYVQVQFGDSCECMVIPNKRLLIRHGGFIKDGQVDHEAKRLYDEQRAASFKSRNVGDVAFDNEEECEYDGWDREDLIERIKELEERRCDCRFVK